MHIYMVDYLSEIKGSDRIFGPHNRMRNYESFHPGFYRPLLEMLREIDIAAPPDLEVAAVVATTQTETAGWWFADSKALVGWEMPKDMHVLNDNHLDIWQLDHGSPQERLGGLFYDKVIPLVMENKRDEFRRLLRENLLCRIDAITKNTHEAVLKAISEAQRLHWEHHFLAMQRQYVASL